MTAPKVTVINLSNQELDDGVLSLLQKGLNYAVAPRTAPIEEILTSVEKAALALPEAKAEEFRQETVRIIKAASKTRDCPTTASTPWSQYKYWSPFQSSPHFISSL
jgi:hypothetical protein